MSNYTSVTEIAGEDVSQEQVDRLCHRYYWAGNYCKGKDVIETACGTGQGLGYLQSVSGSFEAGDYSEEILSIARKYYANRIRLTRFDARNMPFPDGSKDVIIMFEAVYYIPDAAKFVQECKRILRPEGKVLIATANKNLYDFNPSPYSYRYYGVKDMRDLFSQYGFDTEFWGYMPVNDASWRQRLLRPVKKLAVGLNLMPKTMAGKKLLKSLVFGKLVRMPSDISDGLTKFKYEKPIPIPSDKPDTINKVVYCCATAR